MQIGFETISNVPKILIVSFCKSLARGVENSAGLICYSRCFSVMISRLVDFSIFTIRPSRGLILYVKFKNLNRSNFLYYLICIKSTFPYTKSCEQKNSRLFTQHFFVLSLSIKLLPLILSYSFGVFVISLVLATSF